MEVLGIIPARGGSKGIPRKNLLQVGGKSLLYHAIACGKASKKITRLVVSTDSAEIAAEAKKYGAEVIMRPSSLAQDTSDVADTVASVVDEMAKDHTNFDQLVLLQPTAPLRTGNDVDKALELLSDVNDAVVSVVKVEDNHPARMYNLEEGRLISKYPELEKKRRQDLPPLYLRNGCIYAIKTKTFLEEKSLMPVNKAAYVMDARWWVNIDTPQDVYLLEYLLPLWKKENA